MNSLERVSLDFQVEVWQLSGASEKAAKLSPIPSSNMAFENNKQNLQFPQTAALSMTINLYFD
jgi:hypothetical protein